VADPAVVTSAIFIGDASASLPSNLAWSPTVGNYLVVAISSGSGTNPASALVDDNQGHTYTKQKTSSDSNSGTVQLWYTKVATSSGTFTVNAKNMGSGNCSIIPFELSGVHASSPVVDSNSLNVATFTALLANGGQMASTQINAYLVHVLIPAASGLTYTARGDLSILQSRNSVGTGQLVAVGGGKLSRHGTDIVPQIGLSSADAYASVSMIFAGSDPVVTGPGGGTIDDRYRFNDSRVTAMNVGTTIMQRRSVWPDDARDGGMRDLIAEGVGRIT
jgi:hypothetical protein